MKRIAALLLLLAGCSVGPDYRPATPTQLGAPERFVSRSAEPVDPDLARWWRRFDDPVLTALIERAQGANLDVVQAAARLRQARESLVQSRAGQLPSLSASGGAGRNFNPGFPDSSSFSVQGDARWSADLFGGLRRQTEASRASLDAAGFSLANIRTAIAAELARNYVDARALGVRLGIARDTLRTQQDNFEIAGFRAQAGLVSSLDVEQARAQRAATAATIPTLMRSEAAARYRIAVLLGEAPGNVDRLFADAPVIPEPPESIAAGVPADLLRLRPDIRQAERNLAAQTARIGVAESQLYPALTLSGSLGSSASAIRTLGNLFSGNVFASLVQTIFDGGQLRSAVRQQRAATDESLAAYRSAVLGAFEDVENALVATDSARARATELAVQQDAAVYAAVLARSQYRAGLTDFRTLLDVERSLLSARDGLAGARADLASAAIQLYLAIGGGWDPTALDQGASIEPVSAASPVARRTVALL